MGKREGNEIRRIRQYFQRDAAQIGQTGMKAGRMDGLRSIQRKVAASK